MFAYFGYDPAGAFPHDIVPPGPCRYLGLVVVGHAVEVVGEDLGIGDFDDAWGAVDPPDVVEGGGELRGAVLETEGAVGRTLPFPSVPNDIFEQSHQLGLVLLPVGHGDTD